MKKNKQNSSEIVSAIREGNLEKVKALLASGSILFKKGKITELRKNIPCTFEYNGQQYTNYIDAFTFALYEEKLEIAKFLIDSGTVDMEPHSQVPYTVIRAEMPEVFSYMLEKGLQIERSESAISCLFLNLMERWNDTWISIVEKMDLPLKQYGGRALCSAAFYGNSKMAEFLLSSGVSVDSRGDLQNTPVLQAVKRNHFETAKLLIGHGADLSLKDCAGIRPYIAARSNNNAEMAAYIKAHEPAELYSEAAQDRLFEAYHVPKTMREYLKNGNLKLEFPDEKRVRWVKLFSYMDVPEISYQRKKGLALVEASGDYNVMLMWEPGTKKIWFIDMEHDVFHAVSTWSKFIKDAGRYINRAVMWEFD